MTLAASLAFVGLPRPEAGAAKVIYLAKKAGEGNGE